MEQDLNLLFVIIRETHLLEMAGGPEMVVYERIKRQVEFYRSRKEEVIRLGHSRWNIWTEELL
jgi:hypothetical protein